jgi:prepilin-type N-terminal cleavage/methylation domain-containing protein
MAGVFIVTTDDMPHGGAPAKETQESIMIKLLRKMKSRGFTLIELLVVIAIIAILAAVLTPTVTDALTRGKMTGTLANGRSIFQALFAKDIEDPIFQSGSPYPKSVAWDNSTEFWINVVTGSIMKVDFSFFSAPGVTPAKGTDPVNFTEENNAWCIVADISDTAADQTPLLFTRNLDIDTLVDAYPSASPETKLTDVNPFGRKGLPTILKGGSSLIFKPDTINENFNSVTSSLPVLRPEAGLKADLHSALSTCVLDAAPQLS